jgi:hypothetical protein
MPSLITLKTNLKNLKYGHDKPSGGSSSQPYITTPILDQDTTLNNNNTDFLLRGGILAPLNSVVDALRLGKFFTDTKSPAGLFFILKQELLSRNAVRTQASGKLLNEGIYNPLSTIAQAGVNAFGIHLNKQGLNPFPGSVGSIRTYSEVVGNETTGLIDVARNFITGFVENVTGIDVKPNRLVALTQVKINKTKEIYTDNGIISLKNDDVNLLAYPGGPGSILGIGSTNIKLIEGKQRTGLGNVFSKGSSTYQSGIKNSYTKRDSEPIEPTGASKMYDSFMTSKVIENEDGLTSNFFRATNADLKSSSNKHFHLRSSDNIYSFSLGKWGTVITNNEYIFTQQEIIAAKPFGGMAVNGITDFRKVIRQRIKDDAVATELAKVILSNSPDYDTKNIESRVNLGDPGNKTNKNLTSYTSGSDGSGAASIGSYDKITSLPLYRSNAVDTSKPVNDLVKFRIAAIDNDDPEQKVFMHFRAFLGGISDGYSQDINATRYPGRGEEFFNTEGFSRKVSLSFMVAAQSKAELIPMYKKLNFLASTLAPDYSKFGYMRGSLIQLTIGGYFYEQVGVLTDLVFDLTEETPWEIGINDEGNFDHSVKELPHIIKVSSFSFRPIHSFIPKKAKWDDLGATPFIALSNGSNTNY